MSLNLKVKEEHEQQSSANEKIQAHSSELYGRYVS